MPPPANRSVMATSFENWFEGCCTPIASRASGDARILIAGGSGFIGTNLVDFYLANGLEEIVNRDAAPAQQASPRPLEAS